MGNDFQHELFVPLSLGFCKSQRREQAIADDERRELGYSVAAGSPAEFVINFAAKPASCLLVAFLLSVSRLFEFLTGWFPKRERVSRSDLFAVFHLATSFFSPSSFTVQYPKPVLASPPNWKTWFASFVLNSASASAGFLSLNLLLRPAKK